MLREFLDDRVIDIKHDYINEDQSCSYLCRGYSDKYRGKYVILKYYPGNTIDLKRRQLLRG